MVKTLGSGQAMGHAHHRIHRYAGGHRSPVPGVGCQVPGVGLSGTGAGDGGPVPVDALWIVTIQSEEQIIVEFHGHVSGARGWTEGMRTCVAPAVTCIYNGSAI